MDFKGPVAIDNLKTYTPTFTGIGTPSDVSFTYSRRGNMIRIFGSLALGTTTGANFSFSLPTGLTLNTTLMGVTRTKKWGSIYHTINTSAVACPATTRGPFVVTHDTASNTILSCSDSVDLLTGSYFLPTVGTDMGASGGGFVVECEVPILEWTL